MDGAQQEALEQVVQRHLAGKPGYSEPIFVNSGASAAVFRVVSADGARAMKVFLPEFLAGEGGASERRRLDLQLTLVGHECEFLVQTHKITYVEDTAIVEMEFLDMPQLATCLNAVPRDRVQVLIRQLVIAVQFLESRGIVHRDIKPTNIHVSREYDRLVLLDLGVAREFTLPEYQEAAATDQDLKRPFLATAQYSSPEYLFRLDEPSERMWHGLNLYQAGAVLHDLIMGRPIFADEMEAGNKWLMARAVLLKTPSLDDGEPGDLHHLKAVASRALAKDLETRIRTVRWDDFLTNEDGSALAGLGETLARRSELLASNEAPESIEFRRSEYVRRIAEQVRSRIVTVAGTHLPSHLRRRETVDDEGLSGFDITFIVADGVRVRFDVRFRWSEGVHEERAATEVAAWLMLSEESMAPAHRVQCESAVGENEDVLEAQLVEVAAGALRCALDQMDVVDEQASLDGVDLMGMLAT